MKDYEQVIVTEVFPAVMKAYGYMSADGKETVKDALLVAETEHLIKRLTDLCLYCRDMYIDGRFTEEQFLKALERQKESVTVLAAAAKERREFVSRYAGLFQE